MAWFSLQSGYEWLQEPSEQGCALLARLDLELEKKNADRLGLDSRKGPATVSAKLYRLGPVFVLTFSITPWVKDQAGRSEIVVATSREEALEALSQGFDGSFAGLRKVVERLFDAPPPSRG